MRRTSRRLLLALAAPALLHGGAAHAAFYAAGAQPSHVAIPGALDEVFRIRLLNTNARAETLQAVYFENRTSGPGGTAQLDADWSPLLLGLAPKGGNGVGSPVPGPGGAGEADTAVFQGGVALFDSLRIIVPAGESLAVTVRGGASLQARDGDVLDLRLTGMAFTRSVTVTGSFPLDPAGSFPVDGLVAGQILLHPVPAQDFTVGTARNLALDLTLPPNGYQQDLLQKLNVHNRGDAEPAVDLSRLEAWRDDGDGLFDSAADGWLGELAFTGSRWELTGIAEPVPVGGLRVFVTVDIAPGARQARSVQLGLPGPPDVAVQMASGNSGPLDRELNNPAAQTVSAQDRITLSTVAVSPGAVRPGEASVPFLTLVATNTYAADKQMTGLIVTNAGTGPGTQAERDAEVERLTLFEDGDDDGMLDTSADPVLGTAFFVAGRAGFFGFSWNLPAGGARLLFLAADVSLAGARDGDVLGAAVAGPLDVSFADASMVAANWPLGSGAAWQVDGMVAGQVADFGAAGVTLAPGEGPVLALDVRVPRNGYQDDVLNGFGVVNLGTATSADLAELHLWRDGGDGAFGAGAGDDSDLGALVEVSGYWSSAFLNETLGAGGARLFVSATVSGAPADSATLQLSIPLDGIQVGSGNDGPLDVPVDNPQALLLSTRALLSYLTLSPSASVVGQSVTVTMTAGNVGGEPILLVAPSALTPAGTGSLVPVSGPSPPTAIIPPGGVQIFTWTYAAAAAGDVTLTGNASGTGALTLQPHVSLPSESNRHRIFDQADSLGLTPADAMPLQVNRGQTDVIPLYLSFNQLGGSGGSDVRVLGLRVGLETGSGAGVVPAELLSRVAVVEGTTTYVERTSLETSGSQVDLTLATPLVVAAGRPVTVALRCDILATTVVPEFRVVIPDGGAFTAQDATSGAPVQVVVQGGSYPVRTGVAQIVAEATGLDVAELPAADARVGRGQGDVTALQARLTNPGPPGTSDVGVSAFAVGLVDTNGLRLARPGLHLKRLRVQAQSQTLADLAVPPDADSLLTLALSPVLRVAAGSPVDLRVAADIADSAALGVFRLRLADSTRFDARDASTGKALPVTYAAPPIEGGALTVEARAETLMASGTPLFPAQVGVGSANVAALRAVLGHPGAPGTARIRVDSLTARCSDESGAPLVPATYVDRLRVYWNGALAASIGNPPSAGNAIGLALGGPLMEAGERDTLVLVVDFEASAPAGSFALSVGAAGILALDADVLTPVAVVPEAGSELPLFSGITRLTPPARTLVVGLEDRMPAALAADGREVAAARLTLLNAAAAGSGSITVSHLVVRAADAGYAAAPVGGGARQLLLDQDGTPWAQSAPLTVDSVTATLVGGAPLVLDPQQPVTLELRLVPQGAPSSSGLRLGLDAAGVGVVQPGSPLLDVSVQAQSGQSFPLWTGFGSFTPTALAASYSNFPNPFAAGRQGTTFAYYLPVPGRVTLRIWSARGERVSLLLSEAPRSAGMHQGDVWDGRNGRGLAVTNGVYLAELVVRFDDGSSQRLLREVAVVR